MVLHYGGIKSHMHNTNCIIIVGPKTFKELISKVLVVTSIVVMIWRYECFIGGNTIPVKDFRCF